MAKWEVNVVYLNNPAGPHRGTDVIKSPTPPVFGAIGTGPFGRYRIKSKRPTRLDGPAPRAKKREPEVDTFQLELF